VNNINTMFDRVFCFSLWADCVLSLDWCDFFKWFGRRFYIFILYW